MGGTESKSHPPTANPQTDQDKQTDEDTNHTPLSNRRIMKLRDPRSPTDGVQRTPIIVPKPDDDSFEDPRSPTVKIARTPIPDTDPRSPTEGITRTPCPFTYPDPRSPTVNVARTPVHKGSESGKFEMPSVDQSDTIEENEEEVQNVSNNNSSDTARLIDQSLTNDEPEHSSLASAQQKPSSENGLNSQTETELSKVVEEPSVTHDAEDDGQKTNLLASDKGSSKKSRKTSLKLSLKAKINGSHSAPPRSPLSTRNLDKDVPSVHVHTGDGVITYNKTGSRRRQASGTPTRLVGKYEPMIDKENL